MLVTTQLWEHCIYTYKRVIFYTIALCLNVENYQTNANEVEWKRWVVCLFVCFPADVLDQVFKDVHRSMYHDFEAGRLFGSMTRNRFWFPSNRSVSSKSSGPARHPQFSLLALCPFCWSVEAIYDRKCQCQLSKKLTLGTNRFYVSVSWFEDTAASLKSCLFWRSLLSSK